MSAWREDLEAYTEHATNVFEDQGQRLHRDGMVKSTPVEMIPDDGVREAVRAIEEGTNSEGRTLPPWHLPGFGEDPSEEPDLYREDCGEIIPWGCIDCGRPAEIGDTCRISRCPRCAAAWALKASYGPLASLMSTRYQRDQASDEHIRGHHLVVSPRPGEFFDAAIEDLDKQGELDDEDALKKAAAEKGLEVVNGVLEALGVEDYQAFYHAWRGNDEHDLEPGGEEIATITSEWKHWLFQGENSESFNSLRDRELSFSPHFHVIAIAHEVPGQGLTKAIEGATGWVIHRITPDYSSVSLFDYEDYARAVTYCISHTSLYLDVDGSWKALSRSYGMVKSCKPTEYEKQWARDLCRKPEVAGTTLGIKPSSLECVGPSPAMLKAIRGGPLQDDDVDAGDDVEEDTGRAVTDVVAASTAASRTSPAASSRQPETSAGELPDGAGAWNAPGSPGAGDDVRLANEDDVDDAEDGGGRFERDDGPEERCGGRMKPVWELAPYYESETWLEQAAFADELLETIWEYADILDRLDPPDLDNPPD